MAAVQRQLLILAWVVKGVPCCGSYLTGIAFFDQPNGNQGGLLPLIYPIFRNGSKKCLGQRKKSRAAVFQDDQVIEDESLAARDGYILGLAEH